jgi:hypothetical protein
VLVVPDAVFSTDTHYCALFSIGHHILKLDGQSQKIHRLLKNWPKKPVNQLTKGIIISLYIATKWNIFAMVSMDHFK